ncbi:2993_t:CDS:2 [Entrophospora sp. SA101]|nr:2993_t:CDS:2 [Entrophospora sp. SA101]
MPDYSILGIVDGENVECYLSSSDTEEETDFNPSDFDSSNSGKEYVRLYAFPVGRSRKS